MALETPGGSATIPDLTPTWPLDTDSRGQGAGHIRLLKLVLKNQFPVLDDPVTLTSAQLNGAAFPSGTRMLFQQTAAPTGWTKSTDHNDKALRVVSGSVVNGGTDTFTTVFGASVVTGGHAITGPELPSHAHSATGITISGGSHSHGPVAPQTTFVGQWSSSPTILTTGGSGFRVGNMSSTGSATPSMTVGGQTAAVGEGAEHTHDMSLDLAYADVIIAVKN